MFVCTQYEKYFSFKTASFILIYSHSTHAVTLCGVCVCLIKFHQGMNQNIPEFYWTPMNLLNELNYFIKRDFALFRKLTLPTHRCQ